MSQLPPGPRLPRLVQILKWVFAPIPFMRACADTYGDAFTVRLFGPPMVFFSDPAAIKQIFTGNPDQLRAGQANTVAFKLLLGPNSILRLDGARHRHERKLLMPPFHGERMRLYGDMMGEIADRSIDTWPVDTSFPFHSRMQDITLDIMLRTVCGVDEGVRLSRMRALMIEMLRLVVVGNPFLPLLGWRRYTRLRRDLHLFLSDEIRRRRTTPPDGRTDRHHGHARRRA